MLSSHHFLQQGVVIYMIYWERDDVRLSSLVTVVCKRIFI